MRYDPSTYKSEAEFKSDMLYDLGFVKDELSLPEVRDEMYRLAKEAAATSSFADILSAAEALLADGYPPSVEAAIAEAIEEYGDGDIDDMAWFASNAQSYASASCR